MPECRECSNNTEESAGRWVILGEKPNGEGFDWIFLCIQCVRDWKQRGLEREGRSSEEIREALDKSYPIANPEG